MSKKRRVSKMCVVNPAVIDGLSQLVGSQADIMTRVGISWNTWTKIRSAQPIRVSVGQRLQDRIIANGEFRSTVLERARSERRSKMGRDQLEKNFLLIESPAIARGANAARPAGVTNRQQTAQSG